MPALLSEALCSRAKRASEARPRHPVRTHDSDTAAEGVSDVCDEVPFARRAREEGIKFSGGKADGASCSCYREEATDMASQTYRFSLR